MARSQSRKGGFVRNSYWQATRKARYQDSCEPYLSPYADSLADYYRKLNEWRIAEARGYLKLF